MGYSKSVFFVPIWFDDFAVLRNKMGTSSAWNDVAVEQFAPRYLLNYAARIAQNDNLFKLYKLKDSSNLNLYMFEDKFDFSDNISLDQIRFSCFSTGVGFLEFWISYSDLSPENIADFSYSFKKAHKAGGKNLLNNKAALYDVVCKIIPENIFFEPFFTSTADFKYECPCFHFMHIDSNIEERQLTNNRLYRLSRSYSMAFNLSMESEYDFIYQSAENDYWGGSSEGLVNITYDPKDDDSDYYLHNIKLEHLEIDYYFLYLLLLNQRFTAIQYINKIASTFDASERELELLNKRIVALKTVYSFNVISDDRIFQNIYSKLFSVLEIECLLQDILDNESQMKLLQNASSVKTEKLSNKFLFGISLLSLFSALIDASSYFDRFIHIRYVATALGFCSTCLVIAICIAWIIKSRNNKR